MSSPQDRPAYMPTPLGTDVRPTTPEPEEAVREPVRELPPPRPFYTPDEDELTSAAPQAALISLQPDDLPVSEIAGALAGHWRRSPIDGAREIARSEGLLWESDDGGAAEAAAAALRSRSVACAVIDLTSLPITFEPEIFESAHIHVEEAVFMCAETERRFPLSSVRAILTGRVEAPLLAKPPLEMHVVTLDPPRILSGSEVKYSDRRFASIDAYARRLAERCPQAMVSFDRVFPDAERLRRHRRWLMLRSMVTDQAD